MKVLITGANGFIGKYVVSELLNENVDIVTNGLSPKTKLDTKYAKKINYLSADLNERKTNWYSFFDKPDILIHLAWQGLPNYNASFHLKLNLPNNYYFIKNMIENGCKNIIVAGTCLEYGNRSGELKETFKTRPEIEYAIAKDKLRKKIERLNNDFKFKWIRFFYIYGKGQNRNSILSQLDQSLKKGDNVFNMSAGEQIRDYLHVTKVAEYVVKIALQNQINGIINCCSNDPIDIKTFVMNYLNDNNKKIKLNLGYYDYLDYEPMSFWGNNNKLKTILNLYK